MKRANFLWPLLLLTVLSPRIGGAAERAPTRAEVEEMMGLRSEGDRVRGQMDTVGFVVEEAPAEDMVSTAVALEQLTVMADSMSRERTRRWRAN